MRKSFSRKRTGRQGVGAAAAGGGRTILLWISRDFEVGRAVLHGIISFAAHERSWTLHNLVPLRNYDSYLERLKPDGVIAQVSTPKAVRALASLGKPVINVSNMLPQSPFPRVGMDNLAVGRLAAEHLLERGFRHFAFVGQRHHANSEQRAAGFVQRLRKAGFSCHCLFRAGTISDTAWQREDSPLACFVDGLPKPVGLFARNGLWAADVAKACRRLRLQVPDDVAIVGVDNDPLECGLSQPPLSSVEVPAEQIGLRAAMLLEDMMNGKASPRSPIILPPVRVVTRQSSDVLAVEHADLRGALEYIRNHAGEPITVSDVLREVPVSRRALEQRFAHALGRSPAQEIVRVHILRAKNLLSDTDWPMPAVAERSGFTSASRLSAVFRRVVGVAPTTYRQRGRLS